MKEKNTSVHFHIQKHDKKSLKIPKD